MTLGSPLPEPITRVESPDLLWPTLVVYRDACLLSKTHGLKDAERLPAHPKAILGRALHDSAEDLLEAGLEASPQEIRAVFERHLERVDERLAEDPRYQYITPIFENIPFELHDRSLRTLQKVVQASRPSRLSYSSTGTGLQSSTSSGWADAGANGTLPSGSEIAFTNRDLDLTGRIDRLERSAEATHIIDVKTGRITDDEGALRSEYVEQLHLYALAVEATGEDRPLRLWIQGSSAHEVPWGDEERTSALAAIHETRAQLPRSESLLASGLASPGPSCRWCDVRHRCRTYQQAAPSWWTAPPDHQTPHDVWGRVIGRTDAWNGVWLEIEDAAGLHTSVLFPGHARGPDVGTNAAFFGLGARGTRDSMRPRVFVYRDANNVDACPVWFSTSPDRPSY